MLKVINFDEELYVMYEFLESSTFEDKKIMKIEDLTAYVIGNVMHDRLPRPHYKFLKKENLPEHDKKDNN